VSEGAEVIVISCLLHSAEGVFHDYGNLIVYGKIPFRNASRVLVFSSPRQQWRVAFIFLLDQKNDKKIKAKV